MNLSTTVFENKMLVLQFSKIGDVSQVTKNYYYFMPIKEKLLSYIRVCPL